MASEPNFNQRFATEAGEHLGSMTVALMALERGDGNPQAHVEQLLRSAHSIKGGAGFTGRVKIQQLAHAMESTVETIRDGRIQATAAVIDALLAALDRICAMIDDVEHSDAVDIEEALARLRPLMGVEPLPAGSQVDVVRAQPEPAAVLEPSEFPLSERVRTGWQHGGGSFLYGVKLDWFECERDFNLSPLEVARRLEAVGGVLDSRVTLSGPTLKSGLPVPPLWYHAIIASALNPEQFSYQLNLPCASVIRLHNVSERVTRASPVPPEPRSKPPVASTSMRVAVPLVDRMLELSGELALVRNQALRSTNQADAPLRRLMRRLDAVTIDLQKAALRMRMQPVGALFDRFPRMVRDIAHQLNKKIDIQISGSEVELDKTVLEILADPLTHLFRNCCDHGIELPDQRIARGKPATGLITLSARQDRGQIVIEVSDDGKGLDPDAIRRKAIQNGTKPSHEITAMSERQLFDLILLSGFSTAAKVTDLSGRGVGMDVVKTNLEQVGGTIEIDSVAGRGTRFSLRLPLTLAIIPCLLVASGTARYAIPQRDIEQVILLEPSAATTAGAMRIEYTQDKEVLRVRGTLVPLVRLSELLENRVPFDARPVASEIAAPPVVSAPARRQYVAILRVGSRRFGLVIDNVLESEDVVVKPLHSLLRQLGIVVASTILDDGGVALILGADGIARHSGILQHALAQTTLKSGAAQEETQPVLLFRSGPFELLAAPLAAVRRIVRVARESIERVGDRELLNIDGAAVNVLRLDRVLNISASADAPWFYLILPRNSKGVGWLVSEILDSPKLPLRLDYEGYKADGVMGSQIVRGQIALFLDLDRLFHISARIIDGGPALPAASTGRRALVVEDTQFFQRLITSYLEGEGIAVTLAVNGKEGLERLREASFDLVVSDIEMPVMDGFTFARHVRNESNFAHIPLLALTTLSDAASRERAAAAGFDAYQVKLDRGAFVAQVRSLLSHTMASAASIAITGGRDSR